MNETLRSLLNLSEIDKNLHNLLEDQTDIPLAIQNLKTEIVTLEQEINNIKAELTETETLKKDLTNSIQIKTEWIAERDARINDLKTQKEYQAAQKEISAAKKEIKEKETKLQEIGPKLDNLSNDFLTVSEKNEAKINELKEEVMEQNKRLSSLDSDIEAVQKQRQEILTSVTNKKALAHYDHILKRTVPAISRLENGVCTECGTRVMPQVSNLLKVGESLQYCSRCKRILYIEELLNPAE